MKQEKLGFLEEERTRREFLKLTGKGVIGAAVSMSVLNYFGCSADAQGWVLAQGVLIAERHRCVGCQMCEANCSAFNDGKVSPYISRVKVSRNFNFGKEILPVDKFGYADGYFGNKLMTPDTCKQCDDPWCANACPMKAIYADSGTGVRKVDVNKCIGCGVCTKSCPWNMPTVDPDTKKSTKCILCGLCAQYCPSGALRLVGWGEVRRIMEKLGFKIN